MFLDRDGTISEEVGYLNHADGFRMFAFAAPAVRKLNQAGFAVFVVTNQSGVARGFFPESVLRDIHERMQRELSLLGAHLDGIYYCPHGPDDACECRKPAAGMIDRAAREHALDVHHSFVVGDSFRDVEMAFRAGCKGILVRTGYGRGEEEQHTKDWPRRPDAIVDDLQKAADWILEQKR